MWNSGAFRSHLSMMPQVSVWRSLCLSCSLIKSTDCVSTVSWRMQPWKVLKGFSHSCSFPSPGQPEDRQTWRQWEEPCEGNISITTARTAEEKLASSDDEKRKTGMSESFIFIYSNRQASFSGDQRHGVPQTIIQSWAWGRTNETQIPITNHGDIVASEGVKIPNPRPVLSSSGALPALRTWRCSLLLLKYNQTAPLCVGRLKVSSSPASFQVRNWSLIDVPINGGTVGPGKHRKLLGPAKVTATSTGSTQEKVTFPWEKWRRGRDREGLLQPENDIGSMNLFEGCVCRDLISQCPSRALLHEHNYYKSHISLDKSEGTNVIQQLWVSNSIRTLCSGNIYHSHPNTTISTSA